MRFCPRQSKHCLIAAGRNSPSINLLDPRSSARADIAVITSPSRTAMQACPEMSTDGHLLYGMAASNQASWQQLGSPMLSECQACMSGYSGSSQGCISYRRVVIELALFSERDYLSLNLNDIRVGTLDGSKIEV